MLQGVPGGRKGEGGSVCCWLQLLILPDVRPKNFVAQKCCVTIPMQLFSALFWKSFFPGDWGGAFTSPLSQRLCQG